MNRTERFYKIDQMLHERKLVPIGAFLEALGVSRGMRSAGSSANSWEEGGWIDSVRHYSTEESRDSCLHVAPTLSCSLSLYTQAMNN
ncbi:hypothetical protein ELQ36_09350 [Methylococcus capsulatus]|nr:hypothetical protein [Methylococcus capsulatus]